MKSTRKHELQTNELADALWRLIEKARPHGVTIAAVGLGIVALIIVVVVVPALKTGLTPEAQAGMAFSNAQLSGESTEIRNFLRDFPASPQAPLAKMLLADRIIHDIASGNDVTGAGDVKSKAPFLLGEAKEFYAQASQANPALAPLCEVGTALITVEQGDLEQGRKALEEIVSKYPKLPAGEIAKAHLEDLAAYKPITFSNEALPTPTSTSARPPFLLSPTPSAGAATPTGSAVGPEITVTPTAPPITLPVLVPTPTGSPSGPVTIVPEKAPVVQPPVVLPTGTPKAPDTKPAGTPKAPDVKPAPTVTPKG